MDDRDLTIQAARKRMSFGYSGRLQSATFAHQGFTFWSYLGAFSHDVGKMELYSLRSAKEAA
jgi:hypothetical protein